MPALRAALADRGHAVLQAPPGAGKTTIVPLRLLDEPWLDGGRIVLLEPRRLAARAAAHRMAALVGEDVGGTVGLQTRDERRIGRTTRIEVVTEGILTRRLQRDPSLPGVGLVVFGLLAWPVLRLFNNINDRIKTNFDDIKYNRGRHTASKGRHTAKGE